LIEGDPKKLAGKKVDAEGNIWNDSGKVIGRAEPLPEAVEGELTSPFEDFPDAVVTAKGDVEFEGRVVGKVVEGDPKKLEGKKVRHQCSFSISLIWNFANWHRRSTQMEISLTSTATH
jgi:hypothetical protein